MQRNGGTEERDVIGEWQKWWMSGWTHLLVMIFGGQSFLKLLLCVGVDDGAVRGPNVIPLSHPWTQTHGEKHDFSQREEPLCSVLVAVAEATTHHLKTTADSLSKNISRLSWRSRLLFLTTSFYDANVCSSACPPHRLVGSKVWDTWVVWLYSMCIRWLFKSWWLQWPEFCSCVNTTSKIPYLTWWQNAAEMSSNQLYMLLLTWACRHVVAV